MNTSRLISMLVVFALLGAALPFSPALVLAARTAAVSGADQAPSAGVALHPPYLV